jgi:hypothetical protein
MWRFCALSKTCFAAMNPFLLALLLQYGKSPVKADKHEWQSLLSSEAGAAPQKPLADCVILVDVFSDDVNVSSGACSRS